MFRSVILSPCISGADLTVCIYMLIIQCLPHCRRDRLLFVARETCEDTYRSTTSRRCHLRRKLKVGSENVKNIYENLPHDFIFLRLLVLDKIMINPTVKKCTASAFQSALAKIKLKTTFCLSINLSLYEVFIYGFEVVLFPFLNKSNSYDFID